MRSLALANQKGGVGKTTTAIHLGHGLAMAGASVVLLDLDPQGNATLAVGSMEALAPDEGVDVDAGEDTPLARMRGVAPGFWLLPSPGAERNLSRGVTLDTDGLVRMSSALERAGIDWLLVDCPPRMDQWGWAGLRLCEEVLVPVQAEFLAMHGLTQMLNTLERAQQEFPGRAQPRGVLINMLDAREPVSMDVLADLRRNLGARLLETLIFRDGTIVEASSHGRTVFEYDIFSKGARSYAELVREVIHGRKKTG